jgi:asparagine synthase (glutamine-hydrolysing)
MCGIAGLTSGGGSERDVDLMLASFVHRGPDEFGTYADSRICMGTARLSIIDVAHGQQPIRDERTGVVIVFNGEIFNYVELRETLSKSGHVFLTHSDTEVALRLYLEHGNDFVGLLNGQFAIALWDPRQGRLLLARDRFGICPLFYFHSGPMFAFASEIKGLLTNPRIPRRFNPRALDQIFTFWTPIGRNTSIADVFELPPGHLLEWKGDAVRISAYHQWQFPDLVAPSRLTFREAVEGLTALLTRSIDIRLRADVEVGSYLSGGLDSSAVVALAYGKLNRKLRTYSLEFSENSYDESPFQRMVSEKFRTSHSAEVCREADIAERFERVIWHTECPLFRTAPAPLSILSERVRRDGIKVVLTGEGSDELLLGYDLFREVKIRRFCARQPGSDARPQLFKRLYAYLPQFANARYANLAIESLKKTLNSNSPFYSHEVRWANNSANKIYFSTELSDSLRGYSSVEELSSVVPKEYFEAGDLDRAQYLEMITLLRGYLLSSQGDRMLMGNSVEGRFPFLDNDVLRFVTGLPRSYLLRGLRDKFLLREAMKMELPEAIRNRPKFAYQAPEIRAFFPKGAGKSALVDQYLQEGALRESGLFRPDLVGNLVKKIENSELTRLGTRDNMSFVQILSTQIFYEKFIRSDVRAVAEENLGRCRFVTRIRRGEL